MQQTKKQLNLTSIEDAKIIQEAIIKNIDFELGEVKPIPFLIKLDGGRFKDYDTNYINADIAKIILANQNNYNKLLDELEEKFDITFDEESKNLKFKLESGSLDIFSDLFSEETIKNMKSKHKLYLLSVIAIVIGGSLSYSQYIEQVNNKVQAEKEIKLVELNLADRQDERKIYEETISKILNINNELKVDKKLQNAINNPKKVILETLKDDEEFITMDKKKLKHIDSNKYEYVEPTVDDIEPNPEVKTYKIKYYDFELDGKPFKIKNIKPLVNSAMLSAKKRMKLISKAENQEDVQLKIKFIQNGITKENKEAYIIDYIE